MNTTYGHQTDEILWHSPNWKWSIECRTVYKRNGDVESRTMHIYDQGSGIMWPINAATADNDFYPKYVRQAIAQHAKWRTGGREMIEPGDIVQRIQEYIESGQSLEAGEWHKLVDEWAGEVLDTIMPGENNIISGPDPNDFDDYLTQ